MVFSPRIDFQQLYSLFDIPISQVDCGKKCASLNENDNPFCCDIKHSVPTAYKMEWDYLRVNSDLWTPLHSLNAEDLIEIKSQVPDGQIPVECKGHMFCQREYRTIVCRSFPFFPYLTNNAEFIGLTYYWEYEDRCWVISHLDQVQLAYREVFISTFDEIFKLMPDEKTNFYRHSSEMRSEFSRYKRAIPLLHRNGKNYKLTPHNERMRLVTADQFSKHGDYKIISEMPFADEISASPRIG